MKATVRTITPEIAAQILKGNICNRPINQYLLARLVKEMTSGKWKLNGEPIIISGGVLLDGQHRLTAIIQSGVTIQILVVEEVDADVFHTIDTGKHRSCGDVLAIAGHKSGKTLAAALSFVDRYQKGEMYADSRYTNGEILELMDRHPGIEESMQKCSTGGKILAKGVLSALHYLFAQESRALADSFIASLIDGSGLQPNDPVFVLRERLIKQRNSKSTLHRAYIAALAIKAFNAYAKGQRIRVLGMREDGLRSEEFPKIAKIQA